MLRFIQYNCSQDFFEQIDNYMDNGAYTVVCPSPVKADEARIRFDSAGKNTECITISQFMKQQFKELLPPEVLEGYKGKSELMLFLGAIWKKLKGDQDYKAFSHAFNIFTELRGYTVEDTVIDEILGHYDEEVANIVAVFQKIIRDLGVIDEHGSYDLLTKRLRAGDLPIEYQAERQIYFYGFEAMTASQVDMLKALGARSDVSLLTYKTVLENSGDLDWTRWLEVEEILDIPTNRAQPDKLPCILFPKNSIFNVLEQDNHHIVMGTKNISYDDFQELPVRGIGYKFGIDIFAQSYRELWNKLDIKKKKTDVFREEIRFLAKSAIEKQSFQLLKSCFVLLNKLNQWQELSDSNNELGFFDYQLLKEAGQLDLPRTNKTNLKSQGFITGLGSLGNIQNKEIALIISSNIPKLSFVESQYTDAVESNLATIGPIRRAELEYHFYFSKITELIQNNMVTLFLEDGLLESDVNWKRILDKLQWEPLEKEIDFSPHSNYLSLPRIIKPVAKISSSRLQTYSDCPQKYYYQYIERLQPKVQLQQSFDALEMGLIQHEIIEVYMNKFDSFQDDDFFEVVRITVGKYLQKKKDVELKPIYVEAESYTKTIIQKLLKLKAHYQINFEFEKDINQKEFVGSIDCFGTSEMDQIVLDFKRSGFSFTSFSSIQEFEKNQLWFYLSRLLENKDIDLNKNLSFGYVDLSDVSNSMIFSNDLDATEYFKKDLGISRVRYLENLEDLMQHYFEFEAEKIDTLKTDREFKPLPFHPKICQMCFLQQTCDRGTN